MRRKRISPSSVYARSSTSVRADTLAWKERPACRRQRDDMVLLAHVRSAFTSFRNRDLRQPAHRCNELRDNGLTIGRRRVARLMRENGLRARQKRRFKRTTDSLHAFPIAPNSFWTRILRSGRAEPRSGASDISYVWTFARARLYLAVVIDLFARRVVGRATSDRLHKELALFPALRRAIAVRGVRSPASFTTRTAAANTAPSITRRELEEERHPDFDVGESGNCFG